MSDLVSQTTARREDLEGNPIQTYLVYAINGIEYRAIQHEATPEALAAALTAALDRMHRKVFDEDLGNVWTTF